MNEKASHRNKKISYDCTYLHKDFNCKIKNRPLQSILFFNSADLYRFVVVRNPLACYTYDAKRNNLSQYIKV